MGSIEVTAKVQDSGNEISSFSDVKERYSELDEKQKEHLYAVYLTNSNEEIGDKLIGLGNLDATPVDIQDIVRTAILVKAGAVILVHNHPSSTGEPTEKDIEVTQEIHNTLERLGIDLLDHVIITQENSHSMRAAGQPPFNGGETP